MVAEVRADREPGRGVDEPAEVGRARLVVPAVDVEPLLEAERGRADATHDARAHGDAVALLRQLLVRTDRQPRRVHGVHVGPGGDHLRGRGVEHRDEAVWFRWIAALEAAGPAEHEHRLRREHEAEADGAPFRHERVLWNTSVGVPPREIVS